MRTELGAILRSGGFWPHWALGRILHVRFGLQSAAISLLCVVGTLAASARDRTLTMGGKDIGLLQHPTIWTFFALQMGLSLSAQYSLKHLERCRDQINGLAGADSAFANRILHPIKQTIRLENRSGRAIGATVYLAGFAAFIWNTYQNQRPGVVVPWDFWDSSRHFWGFWFTRVYKLYLFCWFFPFVALLHAAILTAVLSMVRWARLEGTFKLKPFSPDGVGGLGFIPPLVSTPVIISLLMCTGALAAAVEAHRSFAVTPLMGMIILLGLALGAYLIPIMYFRRDIIELRRGTLDRLLELQEKQYAQIRDGIADDLRNVALIDLLFATGLRVGEVSGLDLEDYILDDALLKVHGKGGRERVAFLIDETTIRIQQRHLDARKRINSDVNAVFVNASGTRLKTQGISKILAKLCSEAGIQRRITPHMLRHTVATLLLKNGADIRVIQEFLGHASITTTQRYTHIAKGHLVEALRRHHPSLNLLAST